MQFSGRPIAVQFTVASITRSFLQEKERNWPYMAVYGTNNVWTRAQVCYCSVKSQGSFLSYSGWVVIVILFIRYNFKDVVARRFHLLFQDLPVLLADSHFEKRLWTLHYIFISHSFFCFSRTNIIINCWRKDNYSRKAVCTHPKSKWREKIIMSLLMVKYFILQANMYEPRYIFDTFC